MIRYIHTPIAGMPVEGIIISQIANEFVYENKIYIFCLSTFYVQLCVRAVLWWVGDVGKGGGHLSEGERGRTTRLLVGECVW